MARWFIAGLILLAAWVMSAPVEAATWWVDTTAQGSGNCTTKANACLAGSLPWASISGGDEVIYVGGSAESPKEYMGASSTIDPPDGKNGAGPLDRTVSPPTCPNCIKIRCEVDGGCLLNGQFQRYAIDLVNNDFFWIEGFNARNQPFRCNTSTNTVLYRVIIWDQNITAKVDVAVWNDGCTNSIVEDFAAFGAGRKAFLFFHSDGYIARRVWADWQGNTLSLGNKFGFSVNYRGTGSLHENMLITWSGEAMPASYQDEAGNTRTGYSVAGGLHVVSRDHDTNGVCANHRLLGSLAYIKSTTLAPPAGPNVLLTVGDNTTSPECFTYRDVLVYWHPNHPSYGARKGVNFGPEAANSTADHITSVAGGAADTYSGTWSGGSRIRSSASSVSAVLSDLNSKNADPWTGTAGANLCFRYVNGVKTNTPLWPWPMNERIKQATAQAGVYSGPCVNCSGLTARTVRDVTAEIEALLGPIPAQCLGAAPPPQTDQVEFVGGGSLTAVATATAVPLPSGVLVDDLVHVLCVSRANGTPSITATGYSQVTGSPVNRELGASDLTLVLLRKFAGAGEGNPSVTSSDTSSTSCATFVHRFVDKNTPDDVTPATGTAASGTSLTPGAVTTTTVSAEPITVVVTAALDSLGLSSPQSFALRLGGTFYDTVNRALGMADKEQTVAGAVTMPTWTLAQSGASAWLTMALRWDGATEASPHGVTSQVRSGQQPAPATTAVPMTAPTLRTQ